MAQNVDNIKPSYPLFRDDEYKDNLAKKLEFEERAPMEEIMNTFEWTTTEEYKDLNFQREALTVNPAKACQPPPSASTRPCPTCTARRVAWPTSAPTSTATSRSRCPACPTP